MHTRDTHDLGRFYSGSIDQKMTTMEMLYCVHGELLLADPAVRCSLGLIRNTAADLVDQMSLMDLGPLCSACAGRTEGGCCSNYMEANSDAILLLINRLYGLEITRQQENREDCCFLGPQGCTLSLKPMFCLNYNCRHITDRATAAEMSMLERLSGRLLTEQARLESMILDRI